MSAYTSIAGTGSTVRQRRRPSEQGLAKATGRVLTPHLEHCDAGRLRSSEQNRHRFPARIALSFRSDHCNLSGGCDDYTRVVFDASRQELVSTARGATAAAQRKCSDGRRPYDGMREMLLGDGGRLGRVDEVREHAYEALGILAVGEVPDSFEDLDRAAGKCRVGRGRVVIPLRMSES